MRVGKVLSSKKIEKAHKPAKHVLPMVLVSAVRMWAREWRRFCVLAVIAMLGVAVMTGIYAGCNDMLLAANAMYVRQQAYDLQIMSTLGLTQEDVRAVKALSDVRDVNGERFWQAIAHPENDKQSTYAMRIVAYENTRDEANRLHVLRGDLPQTQREAAVTQRFLHDSGLNIGDTIEVKAKPMKKSVKETTVRLRISASVLDTNDLSNPDGYQSKAFRNSVTSRYPIFTSYTPEPTKDLPYTTLSVRLHTTNNINTFTQRYRQCVREATERIRTTIQSNRERARRADLVDKIVQQETAKALKANADTILSSNPALARMPQPMRQKAVQQALAQAESTIRDHVRKQVEAATPQAKWNIINRVANGSHASLRSDVTSIQSLGYAFPAVFLLVAIMMSLTAMARMVEEERGLIGTYMSLGYGRAVAVMRHAFFAIFACLLGGGIGDVLGFVAIPSLLLKILRGLYVIPSVTLQYDWLYGSLCVLAFVVPVAVCTIVVSWRETRQVPAALMRPKAPKAGARVLLERVPFIWRHISFLNKVAIRNLARFKGRLLMTIGGVAGCTALIVCALALNDTVATLGTRQYEGIYHYDMLAVAAPDSFDRMKAQITKDMKGDHVKATLPAYVTSGEIAQAKKATADHTSDSEESESVQIVVVQDVQTLSRMVSLQDVNANRKTVVLSDDGPLLSQSAASSLGIQTGVNLHVTNAQMQRAKVPVRAIVRNLIGSNMYMTARCYQRLFASNEAQPLNYNALMLQLRGNDNEKVRYADRVADRDGVLSVMSITRMKLNFSFDLMNAVVALIVTLAGGLALAVLFTLASTNISERIREIATLKVLGFYKREVHLYVHKETLTLTIIGILVGLPLGRLIASLLTGALRMPSLYFEVEVAPLSYLIAACSTLIFALVVQFATNPALDRIDPASSLKSIE